jgi:HD-like signal output (HDOD) protein
MDTTVALDDLLSDADRLISFPDVCIRVNALVNDPRASASDIGRVIQQDPGLTARLLRIANSPLYGFASQIDTVSRAVTLLGGKEIRDLVFATSVIKAFDIKPGLDAIDELWTHNIYCAIAARLLSDSSSNGRAESIFIAGLLHDIGRLLFLTRLPDLEARARSMVSRRGEAGLYLAERELAGFDHAEAGGALVHKWSLPASLEESVRFHHEPSKSVHYPLEVAIIHLSDCVAHAAADAAAIEQYLSSIDPWAWERTGLSLDDLEATLPVCTAQFRDVRSLLTAR